jgi:hypothetical protein
LIGTLLGLNYKYYQVAEGLTLLPPRRVDKVRPALKY